MEIQLKQRLFYFFPVIFCFCLPFGSLLLSGLIVIWTVLSFFNLNKEELKKGFLNRSLILMYLFFFYTLISALLSDNKTEGLFSIEVKLTFLVFPYLFFCFEWPVEILKRCISSFVSGCFFACLYLIGRAFVYAISGEADYFFYTLFSALIHPSYFAMYLNLAVVFVVVYYRDWYKTQKNVLYSSYFFIAVFITTIFLCASKLGLISFFICVPLLLLYKFKDKLDLKKSLTVIILFIVILFSAYKLFPESFKRFNSLSSTSLQHVDKTSSESTTVRILVWKESLTLIKNNFIFGTGVGDANDNLYSAYKQNGLTGAYKHKINAHNQFFQTFIGLGVIGFILLFLLTFGGIGKAIKRREFVLFVFSLLIILNFMVESMLQTSAGVLFFVFFVCFFDRVSEEQLKAELSNNPFNSITSP